MINTITSKLKDILNEFGFTKEITDDDIECAIDENVVDCEEMEKPYVGVPAPVLNPVDEWFASPYGCSSPAITDKQKDYMEKETEMKKQQDGVEDPDIHQKMYEIATKNWTTVKETEGWQSGTGYNQFRG
tara:strand:- start:143 stop:532 length:390 start_codon:yes stop_codon:yes gene_type:complete